MPLFRARSRSGDSSAVSTTASHISPVTACKSGITPRDGPTGGYKNGDDSTSCKGTATSSSRSTFADEAAGSGADRVASDGHLPAGGKAQPLAQSQPQPQAGLRPMQMKVRLSFRTDIGGMPENQDNCFIWRHEPSGSFVIGVLDGHGRDVGRLAAHVVQVFMQQWLSHRWSEVKANPAEAFRTLFREAHESMLMSFREHLQNLGWTIKDNGGYLMKRRSVTHPWTCVHGGTSATLVAVLEGRTLLTANVGDSSALLAMQGRRLEASDLVQNSFWKDGGGEIGVSQEPGTVCDPNLTPAKAEDGYPCQTLLITADHSPESIREFERMRLTHPASQLPHQQQHHHQHHRGVVGAANQTGPKNFLPSLLVVYDAPSGNKLKCSPVFDVDYTGTPRVTGKGSFFSCKDNTLPVFINDNMPRYYKNVRKEWASLVATPMCARFQDALAFTRSIGDFHLQTYGVSHVPDVMSMDLQQIFHRQQDGEVPEKMVICLVAASDGVWDNWVYADVSAFFLDSYRTAEVIATNSAEGVTEAFMLENARRANANFGAQADNSTCVACYLIVSLDS